MNWERSCGAGSQIAWFRHTVEPKLGSLLRKVVAEKEGGGREPSRGMVEKGSGLRTIVGNSKKIKEVFSLIC